jgi:hypothetical protein
MAISVERLEPRLRETALIILRRYHIGDDDLQLEANEPHQPTSCLIKGHRVRIEVDDDSVAFRVMAGRWSGRRADYPTTGAFIAAFEEALNGALSGG